MTATAERTNRDNLLAMLADGYSVEPIHFLFASGDGRINLAVYVDDEHAERPFMLDAVNAIERRIPDLEEYADTRTLLAEIPIELARTVDGRYSCKVIPKAYGRNLKRSRTRLERVIAEIADALTPIFNAAVASGDLP